MSFSKEINSLKENTEQCTGPAESLRDSRAFSPRYHLNFFLSPFFFYIRVSLCPSHKHTRAQTHIYDTHTHTHAVTQAHPFRLQSALHTWRINANRRDSLMMLWCLRMGRSLNKSSIRPGFASTTVYKYVATFGGHTFTLLWSKSSAKLHYLGLTTCVCDIRP